MTYLYYQWIAGWFSTAKPLNLIFKWRINNVLTANRRHICWHKLSWAWPPYSDDSLYHRRYVCSTHHDLLTLTAKQRWQGKVHLWSVRITIKRSDKERTTWQCLLPFLSVLKTIIIILSNITETIIVCFLLRNCPVLFPLSSNRFPTMFYHSQNFM